MNNNGARNKALEIARGRAKWLMPWDGNSYLTPSAFQQIRAAIEANPHFPYVVVPMARIVDNALLLDANYNPPAKEEPQIIFRSDTTELFDEEHGYGRRPKVEMLWRLGIPGQWDQFRDDRWDFPRPKPASNAGLFQNAGWVARLDSGRSHLEIGKAGYKARSISRDEAIVDMLDRCDAKAIAARLDSSRLAFYDEDALVAASRNRDTPLRQHLRTIANLALARGPFSVVDKTGMAPSGDPHDYFQPAPYWWPDPGKPDGLPYVVRDGERAPGTALYEAGSESSDRTRLQQVLDDTTVLALAATVLGEQHYASHAAKLIRAWFIDPRTRMNPHMHYAQVRFGHNNNEGSGQGIIELKDLYFFLDAVRLVERTDALNKQDREAFRSWLGSYCAWLDTAPAAATEFYRPNNHGVFYDLQRASIAAFLGDSAVLAKVGLYARERLADQIATDGSLPQELSRTRPRHYVMFTLQGWTTLARLLSSVGDNLWQHRASGGQGLISALRWLAANKEMRDTMPVEKIDPDRMSPLLFDLARHDLEGTAVPDIEPATTKPIFHPDEAIAPFWPWRRP
ncbi:alginate lyase family protein [Mesorhizobium sp. AR10]|uniref:alginate lyase family protein n=1 Tax=Mesorhizobium sp. AR10 TaxID=2865839 RepID=UPI00215F3B23|nr:alginate lyase family protein [Mesorhizobium sp. AR10]